MTNKSYTIVNTFFVLLSFLILIASCQDNHEELVDEDETKIYYDHKPTPFDDTSWKFEKEVQSNGTVRTEKKGDIITFSSNNSPRSFGSNIYCKELYLNGSLKYHWSMTTALDKIMIDPGTNYDANAFGMFIAGYGLHCDFSFNDSNTLIFTSNSGGKYYYTKCGSPTLNQYEKPEIGFDSFDPSKSSMTVKYRIWNKQEAQVSSAEIYYKESGKSSYSSCNATISGVYITATIKNLKSDTKYYVKCKATGKGGSSETSDSFLGTLL